MPQVTMLLLLLLLVVLALLLLLLLLRHRRHVPCSAAADVVGHMRRPTGGRV
jgi:hypothetical protein